QAVEDGGERALPLKSRTFTSAIFTSGAAPEPYAIGPMYSLSRPFPPRNYNCGQSSKLLACHIVEPREITNISRCLNVPLCLLLLTPVTSLPGSDMQQRWRPLFLHKRTEPLEDLRSIMADFPAGEGLPGDRGLRIDHLYDPQSL